MDITRPSWASDPVDVRARFERAMTDVDKTVTGRVGRFLVPRFNAQVDRLVRSDVDQVEALRLAGDSCSEILLDAQQDVMADFDTGLDAELSTVERTQKRMQASKSNAGKIFERFSAWAISRALTGTDWAVWKDTADIADVLGVSKADLFKVQREALGGTLTVLLEADYVVFRPVDPLAALVLVSSKSSMKDRLHGVTMWAMVVECLRSSAVREHFGLSAKHVDTLARSKYVVVTGDIATEQPDLRGTDPRALLQFDVSFCDAAFAAVTQEWNSQLAGAATAPPGGRTDAFYRLSALPSYLATIDI